MDSRDCKLILTCLKHSSCLADSRLNRRRAKYVLDESRQSSVKCTKGSPLTGWASSKYSQSAWGNNQSRITLLLMEVSKVDHKRNACK